MCNDLEGRAGVAGSCRKVKRDDEVNTALWPQDERIGEVVGQAAVHHVDLFAFHIQRLVDANKLVRVWKNNHANRMNAWDYWLFPSPAATFYSTCVGSVMFPYSESPVLHCTIRVGYNLKNAFNHTFDYHLSYDRKHLITVKTTGTNLLTKGRDPFLEYEITDLQRSTHRQLNSLGFPQAKSGYITTPILLLLLDIHIKE